MPKADFRAGGKLAIISFMAAASAEKLGKSAMKMNNREASAKVQMRTDFQRTRTS